MPNARPAPPKPNPRRKPSPKNGMVVIEHVAKPGLHGHKVVGKAPAR